MPFLHTPFHEAGAMFSPDGRWLAYTSDESAQWEVYVRPIPGPGSKWQISTNGGSHPVWTANGQELFYRNGNKMMAVDISTDPVFIAGEPELLFEGSYLLEGDIEVSNYDVTPDGQRFVMIEEADGQKATEVYVVLNWFDELERLVPTN